MSHLAERIFNALPALNKKFEFEEVKEQCEQAGAAAENAMIDAELLGKIDNFNPGDVLGIQLNTEMSYLSHDDLMILQKDIEQMLPDGVTALILPAGAALYSTTQEVLVQRIASVIELALKVSSVDARLAATAVLEGLHT